MGLKKQVTNNDSWLVIGWMIFNTLITLGAIWMAVDCYESRRIDNRAHEKQIREIEKRIELLDTKVQVLAEKNDTVIVNINNYLKK